MPGRCSTRETHPGGPDGGSGHGGDESSGSVHCCDGCVYAYESSVVEESVGIETREQINAAAWRHVDRACYILAPITCYWDLAPRAMTRTSDVTGNGDDVIGDGSLGPEANPLPSIARGRYSIAGARVSLKRQLISRFRRAVSSLRHQMRPLNGSRS
jgi:hypothetical protein